MSTMQVKNMSFKLGQTLTITGTPDPEATNFAINIGNSEQNIALHLNPRFQAHGDERQVVCNSLQGGSWCEEHRDESFPFQQGEEFKISITFTKEEFLVALTDGSEIHFPNRQQEDQFMFLFFEGEARIQSLEIK